MKLKYFSIYSHGDTLRGVIIFPKKASYPCKTAVISHGFSSNMAITMPYAKPFLKAGFIAVLYDFCRSGSGISGGGSTKMSVLTEKENLNDLLWYVSHLKEVDKSNIVLAGCSQGGLVSALSAAENESLVRALVLYYPALCIPDDARRGHMITARFEPDNIPDEFFAIAVRLGRRYAQDAAALDPYRQITAYKGPVLIVHGTGDKLVDISYSKRAAELYEDCRLEEVRGDHGFIASGLSASNKATSRFLYEHGLA